jgi:hypothetical protein
MPVQWRGHLKTSRRRDVLTFEHHKAVAALRENICKRVRGATDHGNGGGYGTAGSYGGGRQFVNADPVGYFHILYNAAIGVFFTSVNGNV